MTSATGREAALAESSAGSAVCSALAALDEALLPRDGAVTAATETRLQTAIYLLGKEGDRGSLLQELEGFAASLRLMAEAKRMGRRNLYASKLARIRRARAATEC
jgi:hypothetical protein